MTLYYIDTKYGCGGVVVGQGGRIIETCPLYKWMLRKPLTEVLRGLRNSKKLNSCKKIPDEVNNGNSKK